MWQGEAQWIIISVVVVVVAGARDNNKSAHCIPYSLVLLLLLMHIVRCVWSVEEIFATAAAATAAAGLRV